MPDVPTSLPIRAILETLIQSVGVMRDMLTHIRKLREDRWAPQRGPLRTFLSAQSLVECARKLQNLIDEFQASFGTLKQGFVYPNLDNDALARQNEFWWCCARAAAELGTLQSSSARVKRAESMVRAIANDLATFAGPSNVIVNCLAGQKHGHQERLAEDNVMFTLETLVESPTGRTHYLGPFAADELDVESRLVAELARVDRDWPATGNKTTPLKDRPFDAMQNCLRTNWHEQIEKFKGIAEGLQEHQRRQEEGFERVSRAIENVAPARKAVGPAPTPAPEQSPPSKTEGVEYADAGGPTPDPYDSRKAVWAGKRIYLGDDTQISRLFWMLAKPVGRAASLAEVQRAIDSMETPRDGRPDDVRKADQRVWKVVSKLRASLLEAGLDDHVLIVRGGTQADPEYSMVWRFGK
jgi:hypothetical protein